MTDEKWSLPARFQATPETLPEFDKQQQEMAAASPFSTDPKLREMQRAQIIATDPSCSPTERAEAYLTLGRPDLAVQVPGLSKEEWSRCGHIHWANERPDDEWCGHAQSAQFVERDLYSASREAHGHLLRCNICGFRNLVLELPEHIAEGRRKRAEARRKARRP